jgi:hypothetical protein
MSASSLVTNTNGLDAAAFVRPLVEDAAKYGHLNVEIAIFDRGSGPDRGNNLGSRDELARPLDQHAENVEGARTHRQRHENAALVSSEQNADPPFETELAEKPDIGRGRCVHAVARCVSPNFRKF